MSSTIRVKNNSKVDHPSHYNQGSIEVIDYIEDLGFGEDFCAGNAIKYISRYKFKNGLEDLHKSMWYIKRLIESLEKRASKTSKPKSKKKNSSRKSKK